MIRGSVESSGDAVLPVCVRGGHGTALEIRAVIDTGFNERLTLPPGLVQAMKLEFREEGRYVLANGSFTISRVFAAEIEWLDGW